MAMSSQAAPSQGSINSARLDELKVKKAQFEQSALAVARKLVEERSSQKKPNLFRLGIVNAATDLNDWTLGDL